MEHWRRLYWLGAASLAWPERSHHHLEALDLDRNIYNSRLASQLAYKAGLCLGLAAPLELQCPAGMQAGQLLLLLLFTPSERQKSFRAQTLELDSFKSSLVSWVRCVCVYIYIAHRLRTKMFVLASVSSLQCHYYYPNYSSIYYFFQLDND